MKKALLLIAHGSRNAHANGDLYALAEELHTDYAIVEPAFLELAEPTIEIAAQRCVALGAECVIIVPYFLSPGVHVERDLVDHCAQLAETFPDVQWRLAKPIGRHPLVRDIVLDRVRAEDA
jgi:sirohydrochlorin ferrochelatase